MVASLFSKPVQWRMDVLLLKIFERMRFGKLFLRKRGGGGDWKQYVRIG